ncbi:hypothetical protein [Bifidobacterium choerinum]|nr:hypothetical protein [Bifidobacterium choerinum]
MTREGMPMLDEYQYERRFFCRSMPTEFDDGDAPALIIQGYFVHADRYALRVRLTTHALRIPMTADLDARTVLAEHRDIFRTATIGVKGPSVGGTRYEASRDIDAQVAAALVLRGGDVIIKNRYTAWIGADGWNIDVFGGANAPLVVAAAQRSTPVTNLIIPRFCVTEITDEPRFSNDELSWRPFTRWADDFEDELARNGPSFQQSFGTNTME